MSEPASSQPPAANLALIGARGAGKSSIGPVLAARLDMDFVETDERVLAMFQEQTVQEAWRIHGEAAWRKVELEVALDLVQGEAQVIAMGGGMPVIPGVGEAIRGAQEAGRLVVVYLEATEQLLIQRLTGREGDRPSLTGNGVIEEIETVLADRDPVYRALCDMAFRAVEEPTDTTVDRLVSVLG